MEQVDFIILLNYGDKGKENLMSLKRCFESYNLHSKADIFFIGGRQDGSDLGVENEWLLAGHRSKS